MSDKLAKSTRLARACDEAQSLPSIAKCLALADTLSDSDTARLDVELLLCETLKKNRAYLYTWPEKALNCEQFEAFKTLLQRRQQGEPIAYLLGRQDFWNLELEVAPNTLIPRPETELLVELALDKASSESQILDLGTGTGAIALALASELPQAQVLGLDRIDRAVELAKRNKKRNALKNVEFVLSNWFEGISGRFDLIVSNPPYIKEGDVHLKQGDLRFEPESALVSGDDGLADIRHIIQASKKHLFEDAWLLIEHGYAQAEDLRFLFVAAGFEQVCTSKDLANKDRVTMGCWRGD